MIRGLAPFFLAFLAGLSPAFAQKVEVDVFELDNGMKFLLVPRDDQPNAVSAGWVAKVGSVNERPGMTGISHFFEHMMFKGTRTIGTRDPAKDAELETQIHAARDELRLHHLTGQYQRWRDGEIEDPWDPKFDTDAMKALRTRLAELVAQQKAISVPNEFDAVYTKLGGTGMNAFTTYDLTFYFIRVPSNKFELWAWMESDRLADPVFREFYAERDVVHEERRMRTESTPTGIYQEQFEAMFWQSSPYSWPVIGWRSDLNAYTHEQAQAYFDTYYGPGNLVGVVVGDFDPAAVKAHITRYFGRLKPGPTPPPVVTLEMPQTVEKRMYAECEAQPQVQVRYHTVPFGHPDEFALEVMAELLNGRTGRLQRSVVEEQELASSAAVQQESRRMAGTFSFSGECKGEATPEQVEEAWYAELKRLQDEPVPADELTKVKNRVQADSFRRLQDNFFLMLQLGYYEALGGWEYLNESPAALLAVSPEDIQRVAKEYFARTNRCVAVFTRKAGAAPEAVDAELEALDPQVRGMVKNALKRLQEIGTAAEMRMGLQALEMQAGQAPPQLKPAVDLLLKRARARLAELEAAEGAPETPETPDTPEAPDAPETGDAQQGGE